MTIVKVTTKFGQWDEAAERLAQQGLTLTVENTIEVSHRQIQRGLFEIFYLCAADVLAGFSVDAQDIKADS